MNQEPNAARVAALDGIRGLAVLVVVIHNAAWIGGEPSGLAAKMFESAAATGWVGVQLFFVLSGLLITNILLDSRGAPDFFRCFYIRRLLRIAPLYYVVLSAVLIAAVLLPSRPSWSGLLLREQWVYWLYLSNWTDPFGHSVPLLSHVWSLAVEEQFYLLWPAVVYALGPRPLTWLSTMLVISGPLVRLALYGAGLPQNALYTFTVARWDALAAGALLALTLRAPPLRSWLFANLQRMLLALLTVMLVLVVHQRGFHDGELPVQVVGQSVVALLSALLLAWTIAHSGEARAAPRALRGGVLPHLGKYSYAIYLLHMPLHRVLQPMLERWVNSVSGVAYLAREISYCALVLILAYTMARVTWVVIESPFLSLKDRLAPRAGETSLSAVQRT